MSLKSGNEIAHVYPNPARETITFQVNTSLLKSTASLHDISGRRIQSIVITDNQQQISIKSLASGVYILKFADGSSQTFVKE